MKQREPGYYWVKRSSLSKWEPMCWAGELFHDGLGYLTSVDQINETRIPSPAQVEINPRDLEDNWAPLDMTSKDAKLPLFYTAERFTKNYEKEVLNIFFNAEDNTPPIRLAKIGKALENCALAHQGKVIRNYTLPVGSIVSLHHARGVSIKEFVVNDGKLIYHPDNEQLVLSYLVDYNWMEDHKN